MKGRGRPFPLCGAWRAGAGLDGEAGDWAEALGGFQPIKVGGGDPLLGVCGHVGDERVAADGIEFAKDVVEQVNRCGLAGGFEQSALCEFEGERDRALLAFAGEIGGRFAVDAQRDVIAVGADHRLAGAPFAFTGVDDGLVEVGSAGGDVIERERFVFATDGGLCFGGEGVELCNHLRTSADDLAAVFDEDLIVGEDFFFAAVAFAQQQVFGHQCTAVAGQ